MQYLLPVEAGPSSNTWPKCEPQVLQVTSVLFIPRDESSWNSTAPDRAWSKLGQPVPLSNLASEENNWVPQTTQANMPFECSFSKGLVKGASVPFSLKILYCSGVSFFF